MAELKYRQIFETIKSRILDGTYPVGSLIPDQNSLAEEFKTSRMTVKKSLDMLAKEGFIYSRRGAGTYVRKNALAQRDALPVNEYEGLTHQLGADRVKSKVISFNVTRQAIRFMKSSVCAFATTNLMCLSTRSCRSEWFLI